MSKTRKVATPKYTKEEVSPVEPVITFELYDSCNRVMCGGLCRGEIIQNMITDALNNKTAESVSIWIDGVFEKRHFGGDHE